MTTENENEDKNYNVTENEELLQFIEVWEGIDADKKEVSDRMKEHKAEIKARGYDVKIIGKIVKLRKRTPEDIQEEEMLTETYKAAIGMEV